ncbi:MAG: ABC transporter permease [Acidimicrobiales bacterium]|nr:ABC transporter permease [Acidimicrobiales bacterium]
MNGGLLLQRVLDGLANGSLYGSLALAITLVYRATGRVNLAQGELATSGTYLALILTSAATPALAGTTLAARWLPGAPWPRAVAIVAAMAGSAVLGAALERFLLRRVPEHDAGAALSLTVAVLLLVNALASQWFGNGTRAFPPPFPDAPQDQFLFLGARLRYTTIGMWCTLLVVLGLLHVFLLRSRFGLAFRAVSSSRTNSALHGIRVGTVLSGTWALAAALGALVGCLAATRLLLTPSMMTRLLVYSLVAASIGGLSSPGGALVGGVIVGVGQSMLGGYVPGVDAVLAFPLLVGFMIIMLYVRPGGLFGGAASRTLRLDHGVPGAAPPTEATARSRAAGAAPRWSIVRNSATWRRAVVGSAIAAVLVVIGAAFVLPYVEARLLTEVVATAVALWGLGFLIGDAGRISLAHATFMGVGAYSVAIGAARWGLHPFVGVVVAAVAGFVVGGLLSLPALRIRGQYLAMVTFALAVIFPSLLNRFKWFTGGELGPPPTDVPQAPSWLPLPAGRTFAWLHVVSVLTAVGLGWMLANLRRSAFGRAVRAGSEHEAAAVAMGVDLTRVRTLTFATATALAAVGGAFVAVQTQAVTSARFDVMRSLALYAMVAVFGAGSLTSAVAASLAFMGTPWLLQKLDLSLGAAGVPPDAPGGGAYLVWGLALVVITVAVPGGLVPWAQRRLQHVVRVVEEEHIGLVPPEPSPPTGGAERERPARSRVPSRARRLLDDAEPPPAVADGLTLLDADLPLRADERNPPPPSP